MEEREYEFGLDSFMAITVGLDGEPIGGDQVVRDTVRRASSPSTSGSTRSTSASTIATT